MNNFDYLIVGKFHMEFYYKICNTLSKQKYFSDFIDGDVKILVADFSLKEIQPFFMFLYHPLRLSK